MRQPHAPRRSSSEILGPARLHPRLAVSQRRKRVLPGNTLAIVVLEGPFCSRLEPENMANPSVHRALPAGGNLVRRLTVHSKNCAPAGRGQRNAVETLLIRTTLLVRREEPRRTVMIAEARTCPGVESAFVPERDHAAATLMAVAKCSVAAKKSERLGSVARRVHEALSGGLERPGTRAKKPLRVKGVGDRLAYPWVRSVPPVTFVDPSAPLR